jgi:hypothetical protein
MNAFASRLLLAMVVLVCAVLGSCSEAGNANQIHSKHTALRTANAEPEKKPIDTTLYKALLQHISDSDKSGRWPVRDSFATPGALLPFNRIVAYYGNLYSKNMGILGELPKDSMLKKLMGEVNKWQKADTMLHVIPALHYIAVTAQGSPGPGKRIACMPFNQIDKVISGLQK